MTGAPGRFTYNGKELDDEYGFDLYYYGARYMDPITGRFTTPDPVKDFLNPYSYVGNKPVIRIDPTGAKQWPHYWRSQTCTKGYFGGIPDFFLAKSRQQRIKILNGQIDPAEIEWRASMLDKADDQSNDIKSPPTSQEGAVNVTDAPVPGDPDFIGPVQEGFIGPVEEEEDPEPMNPADYILLAGTSGKIIKGISYLVDADFIMFQGGLATPTVYSVGVEYCIVVDKWGQIFTVGVVNKGLSPPGSGNVLFGIFSEDDMTKVESQDLFGNATVGISSSIGIGVEFGATINMDVGGYMAFGIIIPTLSGFISK